MILEENQLIGLMRLHENCIDLNRKSIINLEKMVKNHSRNLSQFSVIFLALGISVYFLSKKVDKLEAKIKSSGIGKMPASPVIERV